MVKNVTREVHAPDNVPPSFKIGDRVVLTDKAAGAFNNYFLNITENLNVQSVKNNSPISFLRDSYPSGFPPMNIIPVTEAEIKIIINSLKAKDSSGYEEISSKILKLCGTQLSKPLSYVCKKSMSMDIFPEHLKYAIVKPVYKKVDKSYMANYRPVSLFTVFLNVTRQQCITD
jgi:hypothetical protein